ncbi:MAG: deoxyguanosinetriphosphate triphosphohydrolase [Anaerovoracaceae bacterium]
MITREMLEQREYDFLAPEATKAAESKGRVVPEEECPLRTVFQRDRDRIVHSKAFRRLMHKTQVFLQPDDDHYRTRLTHTLEVTQVARSIARALGWNEDLTEAIALGHDLGHTPFGHNGEAILNEIYDGGFHHNEQSLRVVDKLEFHNGRRGMNLTYEVRDGIVNHTGSLTASTPEGTIVKVSDRIAYINHDIDDALRSGVISQEDLPKDALGMFGETHGVRINTMIENVVANSDGGTVAKMDDEHAQGLMSLRSWMFEHVYLSSRVKKAEELQNVREIIEGLFEYYQKHLDELPQENQELIEEDGADAAVKDYIAGMTDRYAVTKFNEITEKTR